MEYYIKRNDFLAVLGDDNHFWLCRSLQNIRQNNDKSDDKFKALWLETTQHEDDGDGAATIYRLISDQPNYVPVKSVLRKIRLKKLMTSSDKMSYILPIRTKNLLEKLIILPSTKSLQSSSRTKSKTTAKRKLNLKPGHPNGPKTKKAKISEKIKVAIDKQKKRKSLEVKKEKKPKIDKSNPNWKLKSRPDIKVWMDDPLFQSNEDVPYVSSLSHSHLITRAVMMNDMKSLKKCIDDRKMISRINPRRSLAVPYGPMNFAMMKGNLEILKFLNKSINSPNDYQKLPRVRDPRCHFKVVGTGHYNYRSLGIKKIRRLNMSRGNREGNNALTEDVTRKFAYLEDVNSTGIKHNIDFKILKEFNGKNSMSSDEIKTAIEYGHYKLAASLIDWDMKTEALGSNWSKFHLESLTKTDKSLDWNPPIREISVRKKGAYGLTPLHVACINPSTKPLQEIVAACPDFQLTDGIGRQPVHFAAVNEKTDCLDYVLKHGGFLKAVDKNGVTPIIMAAMSGRAKIIEFLYKKAEDQSKGQEEGQLDKFGHAGLNLPQKNSWTPLHHAVSEGHIEAARMLLSLGAQIEKPLNTNFDRLTPLMLASANGNLAMVTMLITEYRAKVEKMDKFKRTALTHAIMNGASNVASYLVNLGANVNKCDSSGNSLLHYASAYGWYFCVKLLVDAGSDLDIGNEWKLTPVAVAMLKGHTGIAKFLLNQPGVDINGRNDNGRTVIMTMIIEAMDSSSDGGGGGESPKSKAFAIRFGQRMDSSNGDEDQDEVKCTCPLTQDLLSEICDLIDNRNANPLVQDKFQRNILHYLAKFDISTPALKKKEVSERSKMQLKFFNMFLQYGCDPWLIDCDGDLPLAVALKTKCTAYGRNYPIIDLLLKTMLEKVMESKMMPLKFDSEKNSVFVDFSKNISLAFIEKEQEIFKSLVEVFKKFDEKNPLPLEKYIEARSGPYSALMEICFAYARFPKLPTDILEQITPFSFLKEIFIPINISNETEQEKWKIAREIIVSFITELQPKVVYKTKMSSSKSEKKKEMELDISASLAILGSESTNEIKIELNKNYGDFFTRPGFQMMLDYTKEIDCKDVNGLTQLFKAVQRGHVNQAIHLIEAGANVNVAVELKNEKEIKLKDGTFFKFKPKKVPLSFAIEHGIPKLVVALIKHGAMLYPPELEIKLPNQNEEVYIPEQLFFTAIEKCKNDRCNPERLKILNLLLVLKTTDINESKKSLDEFQGMNSIHFAVIDSSDKTDIALDLEITLLKHKVNVFQEVQGRYPLHQIFRKLDDNTNFGLENITAKDPVEICNILLAAMNNIQIDKVDDLGRSPLHYAAKCGATICCLLLVTKGAQINRRDNFGNTPLGYAVIGKHDGCALMLMQKGANINHMVMLENPKKTDDKNDINYPYLPRQFARKIQDKSITLFQGLVQNDWIGLTYLAMQHMEASGMSYANAVEVAFELNKFQFAKRLIEKQVSIQKLREKVTNHQNLLLAFASNCPSGFDLVCSENIVDLLMEAGISIYEKDQNGCSVVHYASKMHNLPLLKYFCGKMSKHELQILLDAEDHRGRTPIMSSFWNKNESMKDMITYLIQQGSKLNITAFMKPISYFHQDYEFSYSNTEYFDDNGKNSGQKSYTPLIIAVLFRMKEIITKMVEEGADINFTDNFGMTPIMHACKTNDDNLVEELLKLAPDLQLKDQNGQNVLHYIIQGHENMTFDNKNMFQKVINYNTPEDTDSNQIRQYYELAVQAKAYNIAQFITKKFKTEFMEIFLSTLKSNHNDEVKITNNSTNYNVVEDAIEMLKLLEKQAENSSQKNGTTTKSTIANKDEKINQIHVLDKRSMDSDESGSIPSDDESYNTDDEDLEESDLEQDDTTKKPPHGCEVKDGELYQNFKILMFKIDAAYGAWGMYNFYRMQLWKEKNKDLFILFTNWGRIGEYGGQFQNTPFGNAEQAIEEFEKIFRSKTGNDWKMISQIGAEHTFENKKGKYRLVDEEKIKRVKKSSLAFNLDTNCKSKLPIEIQTMMKDLANVSMYIEAYKKIGMDYEALPFGRIKREKVLEAKEILEKLKSLAEEKSNHSKERMNNYEKIQQNPEKLNQINEKIREVAEKITELSTEYHYLMPSKGMDFVRLPILDEDDKISKENDRVNHVLEFTVAERLLLGAQFRKEEINPLDYIYQAIGCHIDVISSKDTNVVPHILRYIYQSRGVSSKNVDAIFKVSIKPTDSKVALHESFKNLPMEEINRRLLWHGTKPQNLISIFSKGLITNAPYVETTGKLFGNGLYFADVLDKSVNYAQNPYSWNYRRKSSSANKQMNEQYLLLCDVYMGRVKEHCYDPYDNNTLIPTSYRHGPSIENFCIKHDSLKAVGLNAPNPKGDIRLSNSGYTIPAGKILPTPQTEKSKKRSFGRPLEYNEYVVYDENRVNVCYLIRFR